jgi:transposase
MSDETLFPVGEPKVHAEAQQLGAPRLSRPVRNQVEIRCQDLESMISDDHPVRILWAFVERSDLSALTKTIRSAEGNAGRPAIDPRILLTAWLQATLDGIGSARALEKLCSDHAVYQWICGGVSVNYHTLADFRSQSGTVFDVLMSKMVATLCAQKLVKLNVVAHDGVRVRAYAGKGSFRRKKKLDKFLAEAEAQVRALKKELDEAPGLSEARRKAARERAARERQERVSAALAQYPDVLKKKKKGKGRTEARVSTTDPDARNIRMPDGGFQPGYNLQVTTDPENQIVIGIAVTNANSDEGLLLPAVEQHKQRYGEAPQEILADGGYAKKEDIEQIASEHGCTSYVPIPTRKPAKVKRIRKSRMDTPNVAEWRRRMATADAKEHYKLRAQTECVHAQFRNRGLYQVRVRGAEKVRAVALLHALTQNIMQMEQLKGKIA